MGFFADFLSRPVLDGFIIGLAITIVAEQLSRLLGYSVIRANFFQYLLSIVLNLGQTHTPTLAVGAGSLILLFYLSKSLPNVPSALVVMTLGIVAVEFFGLDSYGVRIVGEIPSNGIPIGIPSGINIADLRSLLPSAVALALVGFAESVAIASAYAAKHGYKIDANLFFANASAFHRSVLSAIASDPAVQTVLIDAESISDIDITALDMLKKIKAELASKGIDLHFSRAKTDVRTAMHRSGVEEVIGLDHFHMSVRDGVETYLAKRKHELKSYKAEEKTSNLKRKPEEGI